MTEVIKLYECPKCRQLRSESTYLKNETYYSTCKVCRENKGVEQNFSNFKIDRQAGIKGIKYASLNENTFHSQTEEVIRNYQRKSSIVNAYIYNLISDYSAVPSTLDNNYKFINMLYRLINFNASEIKAVNVKSKLGLKFKYTITKSQLKVCNYDIQLESATTEPLLGKGNVVVPKDVFDLNPNEMNSKKFVRRDFETKKHELMETMKETKELKCYICKQPLKDTTATVDHIFPITFGGTNELSNLDFCCADCNSEKGSDTEPSFIEYQDKMKTVESNEQKIRTENANLKGSLDYARKQIAYYDLLQKTLHSNINKNQAKIDKLAEYKEAVTKVRALERKLNL